MSISSKKVLIVDDEPAILEIISLFLEDHDIAYEVASSAEEALQLLKKEEFGVVVVDIRLPGMDGIEFIKYSYKSHLNTYFILLTGSLDIDLSTLISLNRVSGKVFYKPIINTMELIKEIISLIEKGEKGDEKI